MLSADEIAALTDDERRALISQLVRPISDTSVNLQAIARARRVRITLMTLSVVAMVPWTIYLAYTLPETYRAQNWSAAWVGFDVMMLILMVLTLVLGWRRRLVAVPVAFGLGVMLLVDGWFDVITARYHDLDDSIIGLLFELPFAVLLISGSLRLLRVSAERLWVIAPGQRVWEIPVPLPVRRRRRARPGRHTRVPESSDHATGA